MTSLVALIIVLNAEEGAGSRPFVVGGVALLILFSALLALLTMGKGREHS